MPSENYIILSAEQAAQAGSYNAQTAEIAPRAVDGATPGTAVNLNDAAAGIALGDAISLSGMLVAPKRILDDPSYPDAMKTFLATLPWASLENETIFAPAQ